jgi:protein PhnA
MAKGRDAHQARVNELNLFGKDLARRSGRKCELCESQGVALKIFEVPPVPKSPDFDHCIFICDVCHEQIQSPKQRDSDHWRCLAQTVWSDIDAVKALSIALLHTFTTDWAQDTREILFAEPNISEWADTMQEELR